MCLVAQDLTTYGRDLDDGANLGGANLANLLARLAQVPGPRWIRLHYAYPSAVTDELLDVIAREPRVAKYLDVPLQHIDDDVLKKMRRGHGSRLSRDLVARAGARPHPAYDLHRGSSGRNLGSLRAPVRVRA